MDQDGIEEMPVLQGFRVIVMFGWASRSEFDSRALTSATTRLSSSFSVPRARARASRVRALVVAEAPARVRLSQRMDRGIAILATSHRITEGHTARLRRCRLRTTLEAASLDHIVAADVMEHLDDPGQVARLFRAKLRPGGRLVVSGPTETIVYKFGRVLAGFAGKGDYHHTDIMRLESMIEAAGFSRVGRRVLPFSRAPGLFVVVAFEHAG